MLVLDKGKYTGEIVQSLNVDNCILTNTFYSTKLSNPEWHYHENLHICFVFQGGKAETKHDIKYTKPDGSIFFYHSEEKHRWTSPQPISKSANIEISSDFLKKFELSEFEIKEAIEHNINAKSLILKLQKEMLLNDVNRDVSIQSLLLEIVSKPERYSKKVFPHWALSLKELLNDYWNEEISLLEIAKIVNVHPVTISKNFRKYFFCTLGEYRRKLKIEKSINFIKNSKMSLTDIAHFCNFADQSHFIRCFKAETGFLPNGFRNF